MRGLILRASSLCLRVIRRLKEVNPIVASKNGRKCREEGNVIKKKKKKTERNKEGDEN